MCFILLSVLVLHFDCVIKQNNQTNQMQITTIYNYQETCISCTLQCQELGAIGRQLSFKLCCSCDTARTMCLCVFNNDQYPKYILSYLITRSTSGVAPKSLGYNGSNELLGRSVASKLSPQQADDFFYQSEMKIREKRKFFSLRPPARKGREISGWVQFSLRRILL